jgi:hypothetical protein
MKMEQTQCSEILAFKIQTPANHPEQKEYDFYCTLGDTRCEGSEVASDNGGKLQCHFLK